MKTKKALVVGSVAYDIIFAIHGNIKNEILLKDGKLGTVNMMFTARNKQKYFGGTAGNIAYGLGMVGESALLFSVVGEDFRNDYKEHIEKYNVDNRLIKEPGFTATFYGISDEKYQQIGIWQPDVYGDNIETVSLRDTVDDSDWDDIGIAIFSPGTGVSTRNHMAEAREKLGDTAILIFDPSQVLSIFYDKELVTECLSYTNILISNETEIAQFKDLFGYSVKDILETGVEYVIETLGEKGSKVHTRKGVSSIPASKPKKVVETTGAGDAFRAGLIFGLLHDREIEISCRMGAWMGAKKVGEFGGQTYKAKREELFSVE